MFPTEHTPGSWWHSPPRLWETTRQGSMSQLSFPQLSGVSSGEKESSAEPVWKVWLWLRKEFFS